MNDYVSGLFGLANKALDVKIAQSSSPFPQDAQLYGVDEYGRAYARGTPSGAAPITSLASSPAVLLGGGLALAVLLVLLLKR